MTDSRFPLIWDANNAAVLEDVPDLTVAEIRGPLLAALRRVHRAAWEHVEYAETSTRTPALAALRRDGLPPNHDLVMVHEDGVQEERERPGVTVEEVEAFDERFWSWYGTGLLEFNGSLDPVVFSQMWQRTRFVLAPAGLRCFVGALEEQPAGYATILSLAGTAYIDEVVTLSPFRGRGVASATVTRAVQESFAAGADTLFLLAEEGGKPQALYERLGFRVRGVVESFTRPLPDPVAGVLG